MGRKKSLGKKGGVASTLVDIYSIFFYIFVLILFFFIFAGAKGARELSLTSEESDKTIEARMLLLSLLRSPVELSDGRVVDIADMITLNELLSEDLVSELEAALTESVGRRLDVVPADLDRVQINVQEPGLYDVAHLVNASRDDIGADPNLPSDVRWVPHIESALPTCRQGPQLVVFVPRENVLM